VRVLLRHGSGIDSWQNVLHERSLCVGRGLSGSDNVADNLRQHARVDVTTIAFKHLSNLCAFDGIAFDERICRQRGDGLDMVVGGAELVLFESKEDFERRIDGLSYCAVTTHKMQGETNEHVVLDVSNRKNSPEGKYKERHPARTRVKRSEDMRHSALTCKYITSFTEATRCVSYSPSPGDTPLGSRVSRTPCIPIRIAG